MKDLEKGSLFERDRRMTFATVMVQMIISNISIQPDFGVFMLQVPSG
jgi:hypothetical protein